MLFLALVSQPASKPLYKDLIVQGVSLWFSA
jgi:hypothetical protein